MALGDPSAQRVCGGGEFMRFIVRALIDWPESVARTLTWVAPLFARITVGWVFLWSGWGKLNNLPQIIENFVGWGIPHANLLAPFVSGVEFFGGIFLLIGLFTRISAGALGITMLVAIRSAKWADVDSLETLLGFDEFEYLALFLWLAIAGPGVISIDHVLQRICPRSEVPLH
jgi:putative oxidoreductase